MVTKQKKVNTKLYFELEYHTNRIRSECKADHLARKFELLKIACVFGRWIDENDRVPRKL